ncbi:MAG: chitin deacetylase, partial [Alphaproteobacteria bacterium]|nr:chitin deacetylase [Alphaproteobacteria bacterium]
KEIAGLRQLACYTSHQREPARVERLGERRFEVRLEAPFPPGRARINCTVPAEGQRWRWYGVQFFVP